MITHRNCFYLFYIIVGCLYAQQPWVEGNLKGLNRYHIEASAIGLEHVISKAEIKTYVESKLIQYHVKVSQKEAYPRLQVYVEEAVVKGDSISQFLVELSVYDFSATVDQVIDQFNYTDFQNGFQVNKIYENQSIGSAAPDQLKHSIEQVIVFETDRFLNQWRQDNPFKKF